MPHLLFLCTANVCRSPMAEGLARLHLSAVGYPEWEVSSAGTWARDGSAASEFSLQVLKERGIDLSSHRSRALKRAMIEKASLVLAMTRDQKEALRIEFPDLADKVYALSEMAGHAYDITDPMGKSIEEYRYVFTEIDDLLRRGLPRIVELMGD